MKKTFGRSLNGVAEPHKSESHIGRVSTVGSGGKSIAVANMNNSQLRNLVPIMPYGISSSPTTGLMAYVLVANNSGRDGIIGVFDPAKPSCSPGDSMLYSSGGASVHCRGKLVLINSVDVLDEIKKLKDRVSTLESEVDTLQSEVDTLQSETSNLESRVSSLEELE